MDRKDSKIASKKTKMKIIKINYIKELIHGRYCRPFQYTAIHENNDQTIKYNKSKDRVFYEVIAKYFRKHLTTNKLVKNGGIQIGGLTEGKSDDVMLFDGKCVKEEQEGVKDEDSLQIQGYNNT